MPNGTGFTADECTFRNTMEKVAQQINGKLPRPGKTSVFPSEAWQLLCESGLLLLPFSEKDGGLGASMRTTMYVIEGFARNCEDAGLVFAACTHLCSVGVPVARFASDMLRTKYLPGIVSGQYIGAHAITEPSSGSSAFDMKTVAEKRDDGWHLNGEKCFISNAPFADLIAVYARSDQSRGALSGFTCFLVPRDTPGLTVGSADKKIGLHTAQFASLYLDDAVVPDTHVIGRPGMGFSILDYVMKREILITFAARLGEMGRTFETTRDHVRNRQQFGQKISAFQSVSHRVVDGFIGLETARMWLYRAAQLVDDGRQATREIAIAKLLCSETDVTLAIDALRLQGASGYLSANSLGQSIADALGGVIYSGTSEIQRNRIAAALGL